MRRHSRGPPTTPVDDPAEVFDSVVQRTTQTVKSLNDAVKSEKNPVLFSLLVELCSISGVFFQLKQLNQEAKFQGQWRDILGMLCEGAGPVEQFKSNLELLHSRYYTSKTPSGPAKNNLRPSSGTIDVAKIKISIERQKEIFAHALRNDVKCVVTPKNHTLTHVDKGPISSYEHGRRTKASIDRITEGS